MMRVKIIRNQANLLERDINEFLEGLGRSKGLKTELKDIKLYHINNADIDTAMIIYNQYSSPTVEKHPTKR